MKNIKIKQSKGVVLILSSLLMVSTLYLTLASVNTTLFNRKITTAEQSNQQATLAAQAAVDEAEQVLLAAPPDPSKFSDTCKNGLCKRDQTTGIWTKYEIWKNALTAGQSIATQGKLKAVPKYVIELIGEKKKSQSISQGSGYEEDQDYSSVPIYRITGKAQGKQGEQETVIQSTIH